MLTGSTTKELTPELRQALIEYLMCEVDAFVHEHRHQIVGARWIGQSTILTAFIRKSIRLIKGKRTTLFDVANVVVHNDHRGNKVFTDFLDALESKAPYEGIWIESVMNVHFKKFLRDRGYEVVSPGVFPNLYKLHRKGQLCTTQSTSA